MLSLNADVARAKALSQHSFRGVRLLSTSLIFLNSGEEDHSGGDRKECGICRILNKTSDQQSLLVWSQEGWLAVKSSEQGGHSWEVKRVKLLRVSEGAGEKRARGISSSVRYQVCL